MLRTYLYIPEHLGKKITFKAKDEKKSKAEIMRQALEKGLEVVDQRNGAQVLLELSRKAQEILKDEKLPRDLSINHDYYLWGGKKRNSRIKP